MCQQEIMNCLFRNLLKLYGFLLVRLENIFGIVQINWGKSGKIFGKSGKIFPLYSFLCKKKKFYSIFSRFIILKKKNI
jgi:hypothetical protein